MTKTVLITGGARGIGRKTVERFAAGGYRVMFTYFRSEQQAQVLKQELLESGCDCDCCYYDARDLSSAEGVRDFALRRFRRIDSLILNAGISQICLATDVTEPMWFEMLNTNLSGAFFLSRAFIPHMVQNKQGQIVFLSSIWGTRGGACEAHYSASKAGLDGMMRSLACELGPSGITCNAVAPGLILTDMSAGLSEDALNTVKNNTPLCRLGLPEDVSGVVAFLCSKDASFITGQVLTVDGGYTV